MAHVLPPETGAGDGEVGHDAPLVAGGGGRGGGKLVRGASMGTGSAPG